MATAVGHLPRHVGPGRLVRFARSVAGHARARLRAELELAPGERVLIQARRAGDTRVAATDLALYWRPPASGWMRLGWEQIVRLEGDRCDIGIAVIGIVDGVARRTALPLRDDRRFLAFAHERIAATRIIRSQVTIDGRQLNVEARRQPASGRLHWIVGLADGAAGREPELPRGLDRALADLRTALGI